jgi:hypothetical protein
MKSKLLALLCVAALTSSLHAEDLPKVLIIGDSISLGYTPHVVDAMKDKAVVKHHKGNAQHTDTGLKKHGIVINDLNALTDSFAADLYTAPGNVHFKTEGSKKLGEAVAAEISETLDR